jgi:hypothetical protein
MKYMQAMGMQQEMRVALEFKNMFPERSAEIAKKYSMKQWEECARALLLKLDEDRQYILDFMKIVVLERKLSK